MLIRSIHTSNFRNLARQTVLPGPRFNVLAGANAQGKTNFLEALYLVACLKSFRAHRSADMVRLGESEALVQACAEVGQLERELEVRLHQAGRQALLDGKGVRSGRVYLEGGLNVVLFTPDDVQLPRGTPADRRRLVDRAIAGAWPAYLTLAREYQKTLQSRNRVLRDQEADARGSSPQLRRLLAVYDQQLSEKGAKVVAARMRYLSSLAGRFEEVFRDISRSGVCGTLHYVAPQAMLEGGTMERLVSALRDELERRLPVDRARRSTTAGPHTHDVEFRLDGHSTRVMGSQGQHRALVLAFKVAQILDAHARLDSYPVLLLDDVSSELDAFRNRYLFDFIGGIACQAFLSTTRSELVDLRENRVNFQVVNGELRAND